MKKRILIVFLTLLCIILCACRNKTSEMALSETDTQVEEMTPTDLVEEDAFELPDTTSESENLYIASGKSGKKIVVDKYGREVSHFSVDSSGNIVQPGNIVVVPEKNTTDYKPIRDLKFGGEIYELIAEGRVLSGSSDLSPTQLYSNCILELHCTPESATNKVICLRSDNTSAIEIRANTNANIASVPEGILSEGEIAIEAVDLSKPIKIFVRLMAGDVKDAFITARTPDHTAETECMVTVELAQARERQSRRLTNNNAVATPAPTPTPEPTPDVPVDARADEFVNASGTQENHIHSFDTHVVQPTEESVGYTEHICTFCGYSYQDNYQSKLVPRDPEPTPHVHSYTPDTIPPTLTEGGYTLYVCYGCGDTYQSDFTPPIGE